MFRPQLILSGIIEGGEINKAKFSESGFLFSDVSFVSYFSGWGKQLEALSGVYGEVCVDEGGFGVVDGIGRLSSRRFFHRQVSIR